MRPPVSAKVYRRRRLVAAILAVLVLSGLIFAGISVVKAFAPGKDPAPGNGSASSPKETQEPPKHGSPPAAVCDEAGIKVTAMTDAPNYGPGELPKLTLMVTNTGKGPCDINVGTSQMEFKVTSGEDVIFNSKDCQADSSDLVKNLMAGASETAAFTWKRNRSAEGCARVEQTPGTGTYKFVATLGKWSSEQAVFNLQ